MTCSTQTLKIVSIFWDIVYVLTGFVIAGIGLYIITQIDYFTTAALLILGLAVVVGATGIFGLLGAKQESSNTTKAFAIVLIVWALLQTIIIAFFWIFRPTLLINVDNTFDQIWRNQSVPIKPGNASVIASIERWLDCCGNVGPSDYLLPPYSCYSSTTDKLNLDGCRHKFLAYFDDQWQTFNYFALVLILIELICAGFAWMLANSIVNRWRRSKYYPK